MSIFVVGRKIVAKKKSALNRTKMEESNNEALLHRLFEQTQEHLETRWAYFSLTATEKISGLAADLAGAVTVFVFGVLVLFFFSMGFGWWLGDFIGSRAGGFALAGLAFVPIGFIFYLWIKPFVRRKVIQSLLQEESNEYLTDHGRTD